MVSQVFSETNQKVQISVSLYTSILTFCILCLKHQFDTPPPPLPDILAHIGPTEEIMVLQAERNKKWRRNFRVELLECNTIEVYISVNHVQGF
jgi:hypothetical protein